MKTTTVEHSANISDVRLTIRQAERPYIETLAADLALSGIQNPIILTHEGQLIDGLRRLRAAERLGWTAIPVVRVSSFEAALPLVAEQRQGRAAERMSWSTVAELDAMLQSLPTEGRVTDGRKLIAAAIGVNQTYLGKARNIWRHATGRPGSRTGLPNRKVQAQAQKVLAYLDGGGTYQQVWQDWTEFRDKNSHNEPEPPTDTNDEALLAEGVPPAQLRTAHASLRRQAWIRKLASDGLTSYQIGDRLGMRPSLVRHWARRLGVNLKADRAVGRGQIDRTVDVDRVMATMVADLDAMAWAISTVGESIPNLDPERLEGWIGELTMHSGRLRKLTGHMKDHLKEGRESGN